MSRYFTEGEKALKVTYREHPRLGKYCNFEIVRIKRITSENIIIRSLNFEESYNRSDNRKSNENHAVYRTHFHILYSVDDANKLLTEAIKSGKFGTQQDYTVYSESLTAIRDELNRLT